VPAGDNREGTPTATRVAADQRDAEMAKALTLDEARRIASSIATLPTLLGKGD